MSSTTIAEPPSRDVLSDSWNERGNSLFDPPAHAESRTLQLCPRMSSCLSQELDRLFPLHPSSVLCRLRPHPKDAKFPSRNSRKLVKILPLRIYNTSWMTNSLITPPAPSRGVTDHAERKGRLGITQSPDTCRSRRHCCDPNLPFKPYIKKVLTRVLIGVNVNVIYFTEESVADAAS